jgi:hypothetical protein
MARQRKHQDGFTIVLWALAAPGCAAALARRLLEPATPHVQMNHIEQPPITHSDYPGLSPGTAP